MPICNLSNTDTSYVLICFDKNGNERTDDPDGVNGILSARLPELLTADPNHPVTDIFLFSHGWQGDIPASIQQYDNWIGMLLAHTSDRQQMLASYSLFRPFYIGLHWPSQPWGDEEFPYAAASFSLVVTQPMNQLMKRYVERLGDTPEIRHALEVIFEEARRNAATDELTADVRRAYLDLNAALNLSSGELDAPPGDDREPFDPDVAFANSQEDAVAFGDVGFNGILGLLRQLSFWTMKQRARSVGESGMHPLLKQMQQWVPTARFHLMGHSFGCIVVSSMVCGPVAKGSLVRPINSLVLVQGALSLWSYCLDIPYLPQKPGYFHCLLSDRRVTGPIVVTLSHFDTAVRIFYPLAAGIARQMDFAPLPKYGGIGSFGIQGLSQQVADQNMLPAKQDYGFQRGWVYNLNSSDYIKNGEGPAGAHNDIVHPEVAHVIWQAALVNAAEE